MNNIEEEKNKILLKMENVIGITSSLSFIIMIFTASYAVESKAWQMFIIISGSIIFAVGFSYALKLEREAGYYECAECQYRYIPKVAQHYFAMHVGRTRYMKCPKCGKRSWQKKVLTK